MERTETQPGVARGWAQRTNLYLNVRARRKLPRMQTASAPPSAPAARRLFTALFPDDAACAAIVAARAQWQGRPARERPRPGRLHVTLQFFDAVDAAREAAWRQALAALRFAPFELTLARAELWHAPHGTIAVLRADPCDALAQLHARTDAIAREAGLTPDARPCKPHLTALRQAERLAPPPRLREPIRWRVQALRLVWSDLAAQPPCYRVLGHFGAGG